MQRNRPVNKLKIINDPVYGFINIPTEFHYDLIQNPYFQRLRRIKQLGLTHYVYPGAVHTRFDHVLGAMHLISVAIRELKRKGHDISAEEENAVISAILMHDIGHGPLSHSLENTIIKGFNHEAISLLFMEKINSETDGNLSLAIDIFKNTYKKKFLHDLVSGQLDADRLDYLRRDSFFTGVTEGGIGTDRIIKMLNVSDDKLVVEEKGIYSVEQFIVARRIMYWQVYFHKAVLAAEVMLKKAIQRAKLLHENSKIQSANSLQFFIDTDEKKFLNKNNFPIEEFADLDDSDITVSLKSWMKHSDIVLSLLSKKLINRDLFKIEINDQPFNQGIINQFKERAIKKFKISEKEVDFLVFSDKIINKAYSTANDARINILLKSGQILDIAKASDLNNIKALSQTVEKYFLCYPKDIYI